MNSAQLRRIFSRPGHWPRTCVWLLFVFCIEPASARAQVVLSHVGAGDPLASGWGGTPGDTAASVIREAVVGDLGSVDARVVADTSTDSGTRWRYERVPSAAQLDKALALGWTMRVNLRVVNAPDALDASVIVEYCNGTRRWALIFGSDAEGDPIVGFFGAAGSYALQGAGSTYHDYQLIGSPQNGTASLLVDGVERISGFAGIPANGVSPRFSWGSGQSTSTGRAHYARVEWGIQLDSDGDGLPDPADTCPYFFNDTNADVGGVGEGSVPNGIGDLCECGELSGDGRVTPLDLQRYREYLVDPTGAPLSSAELSRCSVRGEIFACGLSDVVVMARALAAQPPGVQPACAAARGYGAECGDGVCPDRAQGCMAAPRGCPQDCGRCLIGMACEENADCASGSCAGGICAAVAPDPLSPRCGDGICNGQETCSRDGLFGCYDDCGPCQPGENCLESDDCTPGNSCLKESRCDENSPFGRILCNEDADCGEGSHCGVINLGPVADSGICSDFETPCEGTILGALLLERDVCAAGDLCYPRLRCGPTPALCNSYGVCDTEPCGAPPAYLERCPNGHECTSNDECKTQCVHILVPNPGKLFLQLVSFCAPGLPDGTTCVFDEDCLSGICQGVCLADAQPNGTPCFSDSGCTSGNCTNGFCIPQSCGDGTCQPLIENCLADGSFLLFYPGQPCQADCGKCLNGSKCASAADCRSGSCEFLIGTNGEFACQARCGDGSCDISEQCGGSNGGFLSSECNSDCGLCDNGERCGDDGDCKTDHCASGYCAPQPVPCSGTNRPTGCTCSSDGQCASNRCVDPPGSTPALCAPSGCDLPGDFCLSSSECCDFPGVPMSCYFPGTCQPD